MVRATRVMATMSKRVTTMATTWAMVMAARMKGNEEGDGKEKKDGVDDNMGNGNSNEGGRQQRGCW